MPMNRSYVQVIALAALLIMASVLPAVAGGEVTTTIFDVAVDNGVTVFNTSQGRFELEYEAGVDVVTRATSYLQSISGTSHQITFNYIDDMWNGQAIRVLTKSSTAALAYRN